MTILVALALWCVLSILLGLVVGRIIETPDEWDAPQGA